MADDELTKFLDGVIGVVDANSFETMCLWQQNKDSLKRPWKENCGGLGRTVGVIADMPVHLSLLTAEIDGHKLLFIDPTSQVVDHRLIDTWLQDNLPVTAFEGNDPRRRMNRTNAMNFHNVFPREQVAA